MDKIVGKMPNYAPDGPIGNEQKSILSPVTDGVGQVLNHGLKPLGTVTGAIGRPSGEALSNVEDQAKYEITGEEDREEGDKKKGKSDAELPGGARIGGNEQTGQNPLGL
ncbi:hypothetical protein K431DRAFT_316465 [Polychaeton citri CBS 116435]|uniref:Uncharacterized protein n=1 Tax=Polychaeton citri CBS 116435 TaxID=1314669 RepID=A0A9P4PYT5_9PEZI|nr:hypothetical protein K431DRAFT_316465 [Polychaeton citri CBS 116435]